MTFPSVFEVSFAKLVSFGGLCVFCLFLRFHGHLDVSLSFQLYFHGFRDVSMGF